MIRDRIIEIAVIRIQPNGTEDELHYLLNPGVKIPAETTAIHGIKNEDVADKPHFKDIARELARYLEGCDLAGFNIIKFDLPILVEEFLRINIEFDISKRRLIDIQKIFHLMEKRNLAAAYQFYCKKELRDAHTATADTRATREILEAQVKRYDGKEMKDGLGNTLGTFVNDMNELHRITNSRMIDLAGRLAYNDKGEEIINFGKHKGKRVTDILQNEPSYYDWIMKGEFPLDTKRILTSIKLRELRK